MGPPLAFLDIVLEPNSDFQIPAGAGLFLGFLLLVFVIVIALVVILALHLRIRRLMTRVFRDLDCLESHHHEYEGYDRYLRKRDRTNWLNEVGSLESDFSRLQSYGWLIGTRATVKVGAFRSRTNALRTFLDGYLSEFAKREADRHRAFFGKAKLDQEQTLAVVLDDYHNLTVAAAGSGKTRALTARIAFLIEKGVPAERILALAYTNDAADEMTTRLGNQYDIHSVKVRTLHGFSRDLARRSQNFRSDVASQSEQSKIIRQAAEKLSSQDRGFAIKLLGFAVGLKRAEEKKQHEFPTVQQYYEYLRNQEYRTLNLQRVKSIAERDIGNFLFLNGVRFEYEAQAGWAERSTLYRDYHPDFYLSDYGIWIEHWAIDRSGHVPDWFFSGMSTSPSARYQEGMDYKRDQFKKQNRRLLETFHYQWAEGTLTVDLRSQLEANGVVLKEIPMEDILKRIDGLIRRDPLYELMFSFIRKAKTNGLTESDLSTRLTARGTKWTQRQRSFASVMIPIWREYENQLRGNNMLDFNDMVDLALEVAKEDARNHVHEYSHLLVDEFQDITDTQLELIRCLLSENDGGSTLFCVGDHRQNIFSFAGSNVYNILDFDKRFSYPEVTTLSTNYRCPKNVVEASDLVISMNNYHDKLVAASSSETRPIHLVEKTDKSQYEEWELEAAKGLLDELIRTKNPDEEIMVLARYNFRIESLKVAFPNQSRQNLSFKTIHSAKGTEADYVLVLGCVGGEYGFPSEVLEENLLDIVSTRKQDSNEKLAEERRLFYVALTRCKKQLHLFSSRDERSQFLSEIAQYVGLEQSNQLIISVPPVQATPVKARARFCTRCGEPVALPGEFCTRCGNPILPLRS